MFPRGCLSTRGAPQRPLLPCNADHPFTLQSMEQINLSNLRDNPGARKKRRRVGRSAAHRLAPQRLVAGATPGWQGLMHLCCRFAQGYRQWEREDCGARAQGPVLAHWDARTAGLRGRANAADEASPEARLPQQIRIPLEANPAQPRPAHEVDHRWAHRHEQGLPPSPGACLRATRATRAGHLPCLLGRCQGVLQALQPSILPPARRQSLMFPRPLSAR